MGFGFRAEVGYDAAKDFTFLRTNTPDFTEQLVFPVQRGSKEDKEIRNLLEDQNQVDFTTLNAATRLPQVDYDMTFGLVGGEKDDTLTLDDWDREALDEREEYYRHLVLFGKAGSGALNLIRYWLLGATQTSMGVVSIGNPDDLYGSAPHMNSNLIVRLDPSQPLREQFDANCKVEQYNGARKFLVLVGADYEATTLEDRLFLKELQNNIHGDKVWTLMHRGSFLDTVDSYFTGSDGSAENVHVGVIGDVNEATAKRVGADVPTRNARGVAWFSLNGGETKRVKTYVVPREEVEKGASWDVKRKTNFNPYI